MKKSRHSHYFILSILVWITGCQATLALRSDSNYLNTELAYLPHRQPFLISSKIIPQYDLHTDDVAPRIYTVRAGTAFKVTLPYSEMLSQVVRVSIERWFHQKNEGDNEVNFSVKLIELFYDNHADVGSNQPVIAVKLHVLVKQGKNVVHEGKYDSGRVKGERFGMTFAIGVGQKFEEYFSRAVYKAMLITLDIAMQDVSKKLN